MLLKKEQKTFLHEHIKGAAEAIAADQLDKLLDVLDDVIVDDVMEHNGELSPYGLKLQRMWDDIFYENKRK